MEFYDAHIHYFYEGSIEPIYKNFSDIKGFLGGALLIFEEAPESIEEVLPMIPRAYHHLITKEAINPGPEVISIIEDNKTPLFIPYIDTRFFDKDHVKKLGYYTEMGYKAVKILYVPEVDDIIGFEGWERSLSRSVKASEQVTSDIMEQCRLYNLPVLFHVDLRRYSSFVSDIFSAFPDVNINIPHFGSSRREMAAFLENFTNCYTDFSSLLPYMKESPDAYRDFIKNFKNRILFGSDAVFGNPSMITEYITFIDNFLEDQLKDNIIRHNYIRFHYGE